MAQNSVSAESILWGASESYGKIQDTGGDRPNRRDAGRDDDKQKHHDEDRNPQKDPPHDYPHQPSHSAYSHQRPRKSSRIPCVTPPRFKTIFRDDVDYATIADIVQGDEYLRHETSIELFKSAAQGVLRHGCDKIALRFVQLQKIVELLHNRFPGSIETILERDQSETEKLDKLVQEEFICLEGQERPVNCGRNQPVNPVMEITIKPLDLVEKTVQVTATINVMIARNFELTGSNEGRGLPNSSTRSRSATPRYMPPESLGNPLQERPNSPIEAEPGPIILENSLEITEAVEPGPTK